MVMLGRFLGLRARHVMASTLSVGTVKLTSPDQDKTSWSED